MCSVLGSGHSPIGVLPRLFRPGNPWRPVCSGLPQTRLIAFRLCYRPRDQPKIGDQRSLAHFRSPKNGGRGATPGPCPRRCYRASPDPKQKSAFRRVLDRGGGAHICSDSVRTRGSSAVESTIFSWQPLGRFWPLQGCFGPPESCFLATRGRLAYDCAQR